jgi:hypothetical protein
VTDKLYMDDLVAPERTLRDALYAIADDFVSHLGEPFGKPLVLYMHLAFDQIVDTYLSTLTTELVRLRDERDEEKSARSVAENDADLAQEAQEKAEAERDEAYEWLDEANGRWWRAEDERDKLREALDDARWWINAVRRAAEAAPISQDALIEGATKALAASLPPREQPATCANCGHGETFHAVSGCRNFVPASPPVSQPQERAVPFYDDSLSITPREDVPPLRRKRERDSLPFPDCYMPAICRKFNECQSLTPCSAMVWPRKQERG